MKRCPQCGREYDASMMFCLDDGAELLYGPANGSVSIVDSPATAILSEPGAVSTGFLERESPTRAQVHTTDHTAIFPGTEAEPRESLRSLSERQSLSAHRAAKPIAALAVAAVILIAGFFGYRYFNSSSGGPISSIAVLPFQNRSGDPNSEYLSDGLAESLIYRLSQIADLKVSPTSSVIRYKGKDADVSQIASELGVDAVMTGRLAQIGDNLTISVELVDVRNNKLLWGEQYERKMSELLTTQREIAATITQKLQLKLSGNEPAVTKKYTESNEAYQLYLKGRFFWNKRTGESLKQAVEFFEQAIGKDPAFALAYSGLAESYVLFPNYSVAMSLDSMPKAKTAALRAIELDDSLAEPHVALGIYYSNFAWNLPRAEKEFRRAIELDPNYATAHQQFAIECLSVMGRFDEAVSEGKRAEELDPLSPIIGADLGNVLMRARRFDESIAQLDRVLKSDPSFWVAYWYLGMAHEGKGQSAEAASAYRKGLALNDNPWLKALLIQSVARLGERQEAERLLVELEAEAERRYVSKASLAIARAALGEKDKAFSLLNEELAERSSRPQVLSVNPIWDDLRADPRFADVVRRVELAKLD